MVGCFGAPGKMFSDSVILLFPTAEAERLTCAYLLTFDSFPVIGIGRDKLLTKPGVRSREDNGTSKAPTKSSVASISESASSLNGIFIRLMKNIYKTSNNIHN